MILPLDFIKRELILDIILLGHGSRRGKDTDLGLEEIRRRLQLRFNHGQRVRMAGLEFTPPSLEEAVLKLASDGSTHIHIMPFFLFEGKHLKEEIPDDIERIRSLVPRVSLLLTGNLGLDSRLLDMIEERIKGVFAGIQTRSDEAGIENNLDKKAGVVLVRRGSRLEYNDGEDLFKLAENISRRLALPVEPAQAQFGRPAMAEAIQSLVTRGSKVIIVMPYLLFPGKVLYDNVVVDVDKARASYPNIDFFITPTLGVDERLVDIAVDRIQSSKFKSQN